MAELTESQSLALHQFRAIPMLRNSERHDFKTCQAKWNWRWNMGLVPAMPRQDARWFGGLIHLALAQWLQPPENATGKKRGFTRGKNPIETWHELCKDAFVSMASSQYFSSEMQREWTDAEALGELMLAGYLAKYGRDDAWEVLSPEQRFRAKVPFNTRQAAMRTDWMNRLGLRPPFITEMLGTMDVIIRDHTDGHVKAVDHKTTDRKESGEHLTRDDQAGTYIAFGTAFLRKAEMIGPKESVVGMIYNYLRKSKPDPRKTNARGQALNQDGSVSKRQPLELFWREDVRRSNYARLHQLERIADDAEQMAAIRAGAIGISKNPDLHCAWCDLKELCDVDENGGDTAQFIKDVFKVEDPYLEHREDAPNLKLGQ